MQRDLPGQRVVDLPDLVEDVKVRSWQEREVCRRTLVSLLVLPLVVLTGGTHRLYHKLAGPDHLDRIEVMSTEEIPPTSGLELWGQLETIFLNKSSKSDIVTTSENLPSTNG